MKLKVRSLKAIISIFSYMKSVQQLRAMIRKKPVKPEELLVRWTEFVAEFKDLSNLTPHSINLGFTKYYCIDVVGFLIGLLVTVLFVVYKLLKCFLCYCYRKISPQKRKKE